MGQQQKASLSQMVVKFLNVSVSTGSTVNIVITDDAQ